MNDGISTNDDSQIKTILASAGAATFLEWRWTKRWW